MTDDERPLETSNDTPAAIALGVIVALLAGAIVLFMWTSEATGKIVRIGAWLAVIIVPVLGVVAWFMTPRPVKPKR